MLHRDDGVAQAHGLVARFPMVGDVRGKRVVITGASRGLGAILADAFDAAGARVGLVARVEADLREVSATMSGPHLVLAGDVRSDEFNHHVVHSMVEGLGGLDVWISNAGISPVVASLADTTPDVWRRVLDVNLTGAYLGARAAAEVMNPGGRIIATGSVLGQRARADLSAYSASKAGLAALVQSMALDLGPKGITVNAVAPGWFTSGMAAPWQNDPVVEESILGHTALGRWGTDRDLPGLYLFLASEAAGFITGSVVNLDGGYLLV